jgi:hypothetical protein
MNPENAALEHDSVDRLQRLMIDGGQKAFDLVPTTLKNVINERQWAEHKDKNGKPFQSFEAFVSHRLWQGLESSIDDLLAYCRKRPDVQQLIRGAVGALAEHGVNQHSDGAGGYNITSTPSRGTNQTYTLKRLKRDHPELAARVVAGELSANAAAIKAGFRKKPQKWVCPKCGYDTDKKGSPTTVGKRRKKAEAAGDVSTLDTRTDTKGRNGDAIIIRRINEKYDALKRDFKELIEWIKTCEDVEILAFLATDTTLIELVVERRMYAMRHLGMLLTQGNGIT